MLKRVFNYIDFFGNERTEETFFNLNETEITQLSLAPGGGLDAMIKRVIEAHNGNQIMDTFREIILKAYGKKSEDGRRFIKSKQISEEFAQTPMFNQLFMELIFDAEKAAEFINKITPNSNSPIAAKTRENISKMQSKKGHKMLPDDFYAPIKTPGYVEETMGDTEEVTEIEAEPVENPLRVSPENVQHVVPSPLSPEQMAMRGGILPYETPVEPPVEPPVQKPIPNEYTME